MWCSFKKIHSLRFKLIVSLVFVALFIGLISFLVGGNLLYRSVIDEANNRVQQDLNVARLIFDDKIDNIRLSLKISASVSGYENKGLSTTNPMHVSKAVKEQLDRLELDFIGITDARGRMTYLYGADRLGKMPPLSHNPLVLRALESQQDVAGVIVMDQEQLQAESLSLTPHAQIDAPPSSRNDISASQLEKASLVMGAAVPVFIDGGLSGVVYGGILLNKDTGIVDKIGETVFKNETYKGRNVGTATIFYKDLRISTSVKNSSGNRAVGTFASPNVARHVLNEGKKWGDRARVLNEWYITAYEPITDISDKRVGMLYVGVLEAKYSDVRKNAIAVFAAITIAGVICAIIPGWLFTGRIMRPVTNLIRASAEIAKGNFSPKIDTISKGDIGLLQKEFFIMTKALKEREKRKKVESEIQLIQSENQASVGKLAAGVAHEINNPLTAVLTFTHLILRRDDLADEVRSDLETVASQTERVRKIVKSLLDFSRQTAIAPEPTDINSLIEDSVGLMKNQALIKDVNLFFLGEKELLALTLDRNQCQSVLINLIINALDATPSGGKIEILTRKTNIKKGSGVEIIIADTGSGISPDHMDKLFDPFFTTKEVGKGTGLGLAVTAGIIDRHGGTIKVRSKPGTGTTFVIWLPYKINPGFLNGAIVQENKA